MCLSASTRCMKACSKWLHAWHLFCTGFRDGINFAMQISWYTVALQMEALGTSDCVCGAWFALSWALERCTSEDVSTVVEGRSLCFFCDLASACLIWHWCVNPLRLLTPQTQVKQQKSDSDEEFNPNASHSARQSVRGRKTVASCRKRFFFDLIFSMCL